MGGTGSSGMPPVVRGSVITHRRRCGKPGCRCADGELHESTVLSYSQDGRTRFLMLPHDQVKAVRAAVNRYRKEKAKLERQGDRGRAVLIARFQGRGKGR